MSRFGSGRLADTGVSPRRAISPGSSPKKKAFVSTVKSVEIFGPPPNLPHVVQVESRAAPEHHNAFANSRTAALDPDFLALSHSHLLQKQSVRWLNLSLGLWSLAVLDVHRSVNLESVAQFLEVVSWRALGKVTAEEFSILYSEWIGSPGAKGPKRTVGLFGIRQSLLERRYGEADLDLCIGIIVNEVNMRMLNSSISFTNTRKGQSAYSLEVCGGRWLSLCEELFFSLDAPGYGVLRFDEAFFLCACLTIGLQGWSCEEELDADMSLASLAAQTMQFLVDAGASVSVRCRQPRGTEKRRSGTPGASPMPMQRGSGAKCEVTLSMFKRYLLRRNTGEAALAALLAHVQACIEKTQQLAAASSRELYLSCSSYEQLGSGGSPRLWQQAVLSSTGHQFAAGATPPFVVLFMLSDADRLLAGSVRASELPVEGMGFGDMQVQGVDCVGDLQSAAVANDELHESVHRMWRLFRSWGAHGPGQGGDVHSPEGRDRGDPSQGVDVQRDPVYQLMLAAVLHYKGLQQLLVAALFDTALALFGLGGADTEGVGGLRVVCAAVMPDPHRILLELGFAEAEGEAEGEGEGVDTQRDQSVSDQGVSAMLLPPQSPMGRMLSDWSTEKETRAENSESSFTHASASASVSASVSASASASVSASASALAPFSGSRARRPYQSDARALESDLADSESDSPAPGPARRRPPSRWTAKTHPVPRDASVGSASVGSASVGSASMGSAGGSGNGSANGGSASAGSGVRRRPSELIQAQRVERDTRESVASVSSEEGVKEARVTPARAPATVSLSPSPAEQLSHSLSDQEADLLTRILRTSDVSAQNELIEQMKRLRLPALAVSPTSPMSALSLASVPLVVGAVELTPERVPQPKVEQGATQVNPPSETKGVDTPEQTGAAGADASGGAGASAAKPSTEADAAKPASEPNSIEQLMQGQDTGQYAQLLREILRKMSREDSSMQLKSLEEVIELGHAIARKENAAKDGKERVRKPGAQASPVVARRTSQVPGQTPDPSKAKAKKAFGHAV